MESRLSPFQREVLEAFFQLEGEFFLTGGAALAGYHLGHRATEDLELFATADELESGASSLREVARELGATIESLRTSPSFRRFLLRRGSEGLVVGLVHDKVPQGTAEKQRFGFVRVDPPQEILANKLGALLSRSEPRDLVDVQALEQSGLRVEDALPLAMRKDSGLTPAQLAWVRSQMELPRGSLLPGGVAPSAREEYRAHLVARLTTAARPER